MKNLIELTAGLDLEASKLRGLADLIFIREAGRELEFEDSKSSNGFSMILSDIAERVETLSEEIIRRGGNKP